MHMLAPVRLTASPLCRRCPGVLCYFHKATLSDTTFSFDISVVMYCMCEPTAIHDDRTFRLSASLSSLCCAVNCAVRGCWIQRFVVNCAVVDDTMILLLNTLDQRLEGDIELTRCYIISDTSALHRLVTSCRTITTFTLRDCRWDNAWCVDDSLLQICAKVGVKEVKIIARSSETSITGDGVTSFLFHAKRTVREDLRLVLHCPTQITDDVYQRLIDVCVTPDVGFSPKLIAGGVLPEVAHTISFYSNTSPGVLLCFLRERSEVKT